MQRSEVRNPEGGIVVVSRLWRDPIRLPAKKQRGEFEQKATNQPSPGLRLAGATKEMRKPLSDNDLTTDYTDFTDDPAERSTTMRLDFPLSVFSFCLSAACCKSEKLWVPLLRSENDLDIDCQTIKHVCGWSSWRRLHAPCGKKTTIRHLAVVTSSRLRLCGIGLFWIGYFMGEQINWLHLTDLHLGLDAQGWLWPQIKHEFFRDVAQLAGDIGGWDIVFFTGDLTQCGSKREFDHLNKELEELWVVLERSGSTPKLCVIPGNHDLERPPPDSVITKSITNLWWTDPDLRRIFWSDPQSECRKAVEGFFANYAAWVAGSSVPIIPSKSGIIPGDFSASFEKGRRKLGIVGAQFYIPANY